MIESEEAARIREWYRESRMKIRATKRGVGGGKGERGNKRGGGGQK